jgi:TRAP-type uncharacterized transport system substrate-binding protein
MANEAHKILDNLLKRIQKNARLRNALAVCAVLALLGTAASFLYDVLPRQFALTVTGGDILSNRHAMARLLQRESAGNGVALRIIPVSGSQEALMAVNDGKLDLAFIQDGLDAKYPNVRHVAFVAPEQLHFLVRPDIKDISGLRGKMVNMGSKLGGTRIVARQVLEFSGLQSGVDYQEANLSSEDLLRMRDENLPEAIVITSFPPSDIAEALIRERGYELLEIPFPASLSLRMGWVADSKILAYTYKVKPPVPARDIKTVGVNMHLVTHKDVSPQAVFKVLESLYSPALETGMKIKLQENTLTTASGYALSDGSKKFLARKNPLLSSATLDQLKALFGLVLSVASTVLVVVRWFSGEGTQEPQVQTDDAQYVAWIDDVVRIEARYAQALVNAEADSAVCAALQAELASVKAQALSLAGTARLDNVQLPHTLLLAVADARAVVHANPVTPKESP